MRQELKQFTTKVQYLRKSFDRNRRKLDVSTQTVRKALIVDLEEIFEFPKAAVGDKEGKV